MTADPLIALVGGGEFRPQASAADRYLLSRIGQAGRVAILPTAAARESPELAADNGVRYFCGLSAKARAVMVVDKASANDRRLVEQIEASDLVYLTGGDPRHLLDSLKDSLLWQRLSALLQEGGALASSSAGAMVLGEAMYFHGEWLDALSLLPGVCVLPHFERSGLYSHRGLQGLLSRDDLTLLGIDGATACVGFGATWEVIGPGAVTVFRQGGSTVFHAGGRFALP